MCGALWNVEHLLTKCIQIDANEKERQSLVEKHRFEIKNETEDRGQSSPKSIWTLALLSGPHLEVLTSIGELSRGQTHMLNMGLILTFKFNLTLQNQGQSPHKTLGIVTKFFYISGLNLGLLAWTVYELSHDKLIVDGHTHTQAGNDNTRKSKLASGRNV